MVSKKLKLILGLVRDSRHNWDITRVGQYLSRGLLGLVVVFEK